MEYWLWGLYFFMAVFTLRSLYILMQRHRVTHQYKVILEVRKEVKQNSATIENDGAAPSDQRAA